ncbi:MAG TPA: CbtB-domain containing protein [Dehalococcoidia bacterium]|nr:CbtB-domain containing protein [Dehalococcoidia bacterium]
MTLRAVQVFEGAQERILAGLMILVGLVLLYLLAFDQGQMLSLVMGQAAYQQNMLHELFHDGRHLFAYACH